MPASRPYLDARHASPRPRPLASPLLSPHIALLSLGMARVKLLQRVVRVISLIKRSRMHVTQIWSQNGPTP